jgi:hypothetical protein
MANRNTSNVDFALPLLKLLSYCRANDWAGYDPYDALNSRIFTALPVLNRRIPRLVLTQALKRLPINMRPLLGIPKTQNPKALALFLSAFIKLNNTSEQTDQELQSLIALMIERISELRSSGIEYACWGYSFPWQTRTHVVPSGTPNLVCTTFVANALLDAYDYSGDPRCLSMASSAAEYLTDELYWTEGNKASFAYPLPSIHSEVHNANFLAAALLARVYSHLRNTRFLVPALNVARYSAMKQHPDGSWLYGENASQRWIDNFHTGYNLCALRDLSAYAATTEFDDFIRRGFEFCRSHFFLVDGSVRYFHNQTYPIDIHAVAQSVITLLKFTDINSDNLQLAHSVLNWALTHMWDERGYFYYRVLRSHINRISYMRWSQAWMLLAMATLREATTAQVRTEPPARFAELAQ